MPTKPSDILINGRSYSWASIKVDILGFQPKSISAINFKQRKTKTNIYGIGDRPIGRSSGNREAEGSITMSLKDVKAIEALLPPGYDLTDVKGFPVIVSYNDDTNLFQKYKLMHCEFTEFGHDSSQNDPDIKVPLPLIISQIVR